MHRRNSTKFNHLDRRKSASSAKSVHLEHIDPETAERDAQAAASQAFARARKRSATDTTLWPPSRSNEPTRTGGPIGTSTHSSGSAIRRQQSVRFVKTSVSRGVRSNTVVGNETPNSTKSSPQPNVAVNGTGSPTTRSASAAGMAFAAKGAAGDYINALLTGEEYYTPEDDIASAPSSYRRIRKSRSMFTSSEASMTSRNYVQAATSTGVNRPCPSFTDHSSMDTDRSVPTSGLKAPKSMSFLKSRREQSMLFPKRRDNGPTGVSSERNSGTPSNRGVPIKSRSSAFLRSKPINVDKFLRRSMRDGSKDTLPIDVRVPKDGSLRDRARKVSNSFKHKLKSLFTLGKGDSDGHEFPPQQIEASRSHITNLNTANSIKENEFEFEPTVDEAALSRVLSGVPSLHAVPSHQQLRSRQGSVESLRSERRASDERSRVTSWTNSDTNTLNTLNSHRGEWDPQRLSIIKENGMHVSSSSARPPSVATYDRNSNTDARSLPPPIQPQPVAVDSQRIYSALMKRLRDTNKHSQRTDPQKQEGAGDFIDSCAVPPRGSSQDRARRRPNSRATIRHVVSDDVSDSYSARTTEIKQLKESTRYNTDANGSPNRLDVESASGRQEFPSSSSAPLMNQVKELADGVDQTLPPSRVKEPSPSMRTLSTRSSAFFASPTCHLFRTRSPYRRALQDSMRAESQNSQPRSPEFNPWLRSLTGLPIRCPSTCESEADKKMQYAESVYSCTTEEGVASSPNDDASTVVEDFPKPPTVHGDATIFVNPPVYRPTPPTLKHRVTSSASSVEWKMWLSANVSKLEGTPGSVGTGVLEYVVPSSRPSGHVREEAQMDDEDEHPVLEVYKPTRPESALATIEHNTKAAPQTPRHVLKSASPVHYRDKENEVPERPVMASNGALRVTPSSASITSIREAKASTEPTKKGAFDSLRWKSLARKPSLNTLAGHSTATSTRKRVRGPLGFGTYATSMPTPKAGTVGDKKLRKNGSPADSRQTSGGAESKKTENISPQANDEAETDLYRVQGSGILGPETDADPQSMGSKKMVDLFLSSRRRRMASGEDGGVFS